MNPVSPVSPNVLVLRNDADLEAFRRTGLDPAFLVQAIRALGGAVVLAVDVGVGKTVAIRRLIKHLLAQDEEHPYDLVIYLTSQLKILLEQDFAANPEPHTRVLLGRPKKLCGGLDAQWRRLIKAKSESLGRTAICPTCPNLDACGWRKQYTRDNLAGVLLIAGTQATLSSIPNLIPLLKRLTGAERPLVILDEAALLKASTWTSFSLSQVKRSQSIVSSLARRHPKLVPWVQAHEWLLKRSRGPFRGELPSISAAVNAEVQKAGLARYPSRYVHLLDVLACIGRVAPEYPTAKTVRLPRRLIPKRVDLVLAGAGIDLAVARHRLQRDDLKPLHANVRAQHEGTRFLNLRVGLGARRYFESNSRQIIWTIGQVVAAQLREGKRVLLVSRKRFTKLCKSEMESVLLKLGLPNARVILNPTAETIAPPDAIPLIHYGVEGVNLFEGYDAVFALNAYNVPPSALQNYIHDPLPLTVQEFVGPIDIETQYGCRQPSVSPAFANKQDWQRLADGALHQLEGNVVEQALGRVRYATKPRLVVAMTTGKLRFAPDAEFRSLEQFHRYFAVTDERTWEANAKRRRAPELSALGKTRRAVASEMGLSVRQVQRLLNGPTTVAATQSDEPSSSAPGEG